jgi:hypothetical protein
MPYQILRLYILEMDDKSEGCKFEVYFNLKMAVI